MAYRASALRGLAIAQMVFGSLMVIFGIACIVSVHHWSSFVGFGLWVGIWVLITGILGFVGAKNDNIPNKCLIGCFMGFSITACIIAGVMFIFYCFAVAEFGHRLRCRSSINFYYSYGHTYNGYRYCYSSSERYQASVGAGLGSCQLIFAIVEFFVALASSVYCCNAVCCGTPAASSIPANTQVVYLPPQDMYAGGQAGVVVIQPTGAMTTVPHGYAAAGQQAVFIPQQPGALQPPAYWAMQSGSLPAGSAPVATQPQAQQLPVNDRPPPYATYTQTGDAPPSVSGAEATTAGGASVTIDV